MDKMDNVLLTLFQIFMPNQWIPPLKTEWMLDEKNGEKQKETGSIQPYKNDNSIFKDSDPNQHPKPVILRANGTKIAIITPWDALCYLYTKDNSTENNKEKSQEISETSEKTFSAPRSNLSMDSYHRSRLRMAAKNNQHLLEIKPGRDYQLCIWCINYGSQLERQAKIICNLTSERQLSSSSRSIWTKIETCLRVRKLLGNEYLDFFMPVETRSPNQVLNNISTQKENNGTMRKLQSYSELVKTLKNDHKLCEFHGPTDEWLIDKENKEYINKKYGITKIYPLFVNRSGTLLFLDEYGILFAWCEMVYDMKILGINKLEGLANYLYHPEKICYIMKDTGELVPEVELNRHVKERIAKENLEKENLAKEKREKRLGKKKRLAEGKKQA